MYDYMLYALWVSYRACVRRASACARHARVASVRVTSSRPHTHTLHMYIYIYIYIYIYTMFIIMIIIFIASALPQTLLVQQVQQAVAQVAGESSAGSI